MKGEAKMTMKVIIEASDYSFEVNCIETKRVVNIAGRTTKVADAPRRFYEKLEPKEAYALADALRACADMAERDSG